MSRGGYRLWQACPGSLKMAGKVGPNAVGECAVCRKVVTIYPPGKVVRHKRKEEEVGT